MYAYRFLPGHALSVNVEFDAPFDMNDLADALSNQSGLEFRPEQSEFPTAADASGVDDVFVGRVRRDPSVPHGAVMWVVADNLRKGAATQCGSDPGPPPFEREMGECVKMTLWSQNGCQLGTDTESFTSKGRENA